MHIHCLLADLTEMTARIRDRGPSKFISPRKKKKRFKDVNLPLIVCILLLYM